MCSVRPPGRRSLRPRGAPRPSDRSPSPGATTIAWDLHARMPMITAAWAARARTVARAVGARMDAPQATPGGRRACDLPLTPGAPMHRDLPLLTIAALIRQGVPARMGGPPATPGGRRAHVLPSIPGGLMDPVPPLPTTASRTLRVDLDPRDACRTPGGPILQVARGQKVVPPGTPGDQPVTNGETVLAPQVNNAGTGRAPQATSGAPFRPPVPGLRPGRARAMPGGPNPPRASARYPGLTSPGVQIHAGSGMTSGVATARTGNDGRPAGAKAREGTAVGAARTGEASHRQRPGRAARAR